MTTYLWRKASDLSILSHLSCRISKINFGVCSAQEETKAPVSLGSWNSLINLQHHVAEKEKFWADNAIPLFLLEYIKTVT